MPNTTRQIDLTCDGCGQKGSISWEERPPTHPKGEPRIGSVDISGFYQQLGVAIPAVFCSECGAMKVPYS